MFKHEVAEYLNVEEYVAFKKWVQTLPGVHGITLPDGRVVDWFGEADLQEFLKTREEADAKTQGTTGEIPQKEAGPFLGGNANDSSEG